MDYDLKCPKCNHEFEADCDWDKDQCPNCGNGFMWDEQCAPDFSDCWTIILWESNNYEY